MKKTFLIIVFLFTSFEVKSLEITIFCNMKNFWYKNFVNNKVNEGNILENEVFFISSTDNFFGNTKEINWWKKMNSIGSSKLTVTDSYILHEWTSDYVSCNHKSKCSKDKIRHELNRYSGDLVYEIEDVFHISKNYGICNSVKEKKF